MITVRVTCNTGKTWDTGINTDLTGARQYFFGKCFVDEDYETGEETRNVVTKVEPLGPHCAEFIPLVNGGDFRGTYCCVCGCKESEHAK